jgi:outer membrane cobalamin receptor
MMSWPALLAAALCAQPQPPAVRTSITVTERLSAETPAAVTALDRRELQAAPGVNVDDRLRLVPGFSLFRRSSSLVANPTTQGVSLRGLGSTGASRTLVLWDGIPLNDPFGGWVYWTRLTPDELERTEVSRGAATSVFGDRAMGGAVHFASREPARRLGVGWESGNRSTHQLTGGASHLATRWALSASGRAMTTDGYDIVPRSFRGAVDAPAAVRFAGGALRADLLGASRRLFLRADVLAEERPNGTRLQNNSTSLGTLAAHYSDERGGGLLSVIGFHSRQEYRASFSAIAAGRATERLTMLQTVPAEASGGAAFWRHGGARFNWIAGADGTFAEGYSRETQFPGGLRVLGGTQGQYGLFTQTDAPLGPARIYGGLRFHDTGGNRFWTPSGGVAAARGRWRARASAYRAFRAPTLNELYREFRAGNAVTLANAALAPEKMTGVEAGGEWAGERTRASLTLFRNELDGLIANVTLSVTPQLITRQRRNAGGALTRGVEASLRHRRGPWLAEASWLLADSRFTVGERLPQVPRHQGSAQLAWFGARLAASAGLRASALQFEDDRNLFLLPGFAVWHATARGRLRGTLWATAAWENLFNREFSVGFSPTPLIGAPRLWRLGLRWERP